MVTASLAAHRPSSAGGRPGRTLAGGLAGTAVIAFAATVLLAALLEPAGQSYAGVEGLWLFGLTAYALVGGLVVWHRPHHLVGWLMLTGGVAASVAGLLDVLAVEALVTRPGALPGGVWLRWAQDVLFSVVLVALPALPLLFFPDGRLPSRRWRPLLVAAVVCPVAAAVVAAVMPGPIGTTAPVDNPLGIDTLGPALDRIGTVTWGATTVLTVLVFGSLVIRWRLAAGTVRRQLSWLALAALLTGFGLVLGLVLDSTGGRTGAMAGELVQGLVNLSVPVAVGVALLRDRLFDIEIVLSRTLAYAVLSAAVVTAYAGSVLVASQFLRSTTGTAVSLVATALLAVVISPVKDRVVAAVERLLYGDLQRPYRVLASLTERLQGVGAPEPLLRDLANLVRDALRLPYAAVNVPAPGGSVTYGAGEAPSSTVHSIPLITDGQPLGHLLVAPRAGEDGFSTREETLLADAARQIAVAVRTVGLADELQRSRELLVGAREEERRRVRRDLHDGVGSVLAALTLQLDALRRHIDPTDDEAHILAERMKGELRSTVHDVRRIVEGLRPPALDELGLAGVVREHARALSEGGLVVSVDVPSRSTLPPAVEVAAYRILTEAMTNVARHADAQRCHVSAQVTTEGLELLVHDDGHGLPSSPNGATGVGLGSMHERAAELGGTLTLTDDADGGGLTVRAVLPLGPA